MPDADTFYAGLVSPGDLCFDIGANVGVHTRAMLRARGRVIAVEPQSELARAIGDVVGTGDLAVVPLAVTDMPGDFTLYTSSLHPHLATLSHPWMSLSPDRDHFDGMRDVMTTTLRALIENYGEPDVLKVDVEGYEHQVLETLDRPLARVLFEVHSGLAQIAEACMEKLETLGNYRYRLTVAESWEFEGGYKSRREILDNLPSWGDVYAERIQ